MATYDRTVRRGLPRRPGGEPWPASPTAVTRVNEPAPMAEAAPAVLPAAVTAESGGARAIRRGLPRVGGGEPWPAPAFAPAPAAVGPGEGSGPDVTPTPAAAAASVGVAPGDASEAPRREDVTLRQDAGSDSSLPLPFTRSVWAGQLGRSRPEPESARIGPFTRLQWVGAVIGGGAGLLFAAGMAVHALRFLLSLEPFQEFLATYPGVYPLPEGAPVGIPPWLGWQHFFNTFLIVLIVRSGLLVRTEKRPSVFWSPRNYTERKISLNLWLHQSLDILWIINGVIYVVLLFATGQWMKIVPTSWAVFPNAVSAALQYVSLDWPTESGWVNYNSLQQVGYFATVFLAAPMAIATGVRMSGIWPKNAKGLNKAYPVEWARAIHFPVMLYFVAFILVHVALVLATGALRNLNHMYASQDAVSGVGFWIFAASLVVIAAGSIAARPFVLAQIARIFGRVSGR